MTKKATGETITIKPIETTIAKIRIVGDTPLICHAWSAKAKREMLYNEMFGKEMTKRAPKDPVAEFAASMYWLDPMPDELDIDTIGEAVSKARFGFPVTAFKQAAISAAYRNEWAKDKVSLRGTFFIEPEFTHYYGGDIRINHDRRDIDIIPNQLRSDMLVEIHGDPPVMREDPVKVQRGTDIRYRGEFDNWYVDLAIAFNPKGKYSLDNIINLMNAGGSSTGVGEWRPEKNGLYGKFHVE